MRTTALSPALDPFAALHPFAAVAPFAALDRLRDETLRLFGGGNGAGDAWAPPLTLSETEAGYEVLAPLPGCDPAKLEVSVEGDVLRIAGERAGVPEDAVRRFATERFAGRFLRTLELPRAVDAAAVEAQYRHGVLRVTLPKAAEARPRRIEIRHD